MESTIGYLIDNGSASKPVLISERTLDYGDDDAPPKWDDCLRDAGLRPDLVKDFRRKAHNAVSLPVGFGREMGVEFTRPTHVADDTEFRYAFTRPGFSSDASQALIYLEAFARMDGWGMHYLLEPVGKKWAVVRKLCGWLS